MFSKDEIRDLQTLPHTRNASHLSEHHRYCLKGMQVEVLQLIENWTDDDNALCVYWLNGHAGSGKSMIAQSFLKQMFMDWRLGTSFSCSHDFVDCSKLHFTYLPYSFFPTYMPVPCISNTHCQHPLTTTRYQFRIIDQSVDQTHH